MNLTKSCRPEGGSRALVAALLAGCLAAAVIVLVGLTTTGLVDFEAITGQRQRHDYCTKAWREQQLPPDMQAQFADWCEQRPGR